MKKLLILALCLALILANALALAEEDAAQREVDGITYTLLRDGTWAATACREDAQRAAILPELEGRPVTAIRNAFANCRALEEVAIPEGIRVMTGGAFSQCVELTHILLPASLTQILDNPFQGCTKLTDIEIAPGNPALESVDGVLFNQPEGRLICYPCALSAEEYVVPKGTRVIGRSAFYRFGANDVPLKRITVSEGVTILEDLAFSSNYLDSFILPDSLTVLGNNCMPGSVSGLVYLPKGIACMEQNALSPTDIWFLVEPDSYALQHCVEDGLNFIVRGTEDAWRTAKVVKCRSWISLRSKPSTQSSRLARIPLGEQVEVQASENEMWACRYQGKTGYVRAENLKLEG